MTKTIRVKVAGEERIVDVAISPETTVREILATANCPSEYFLTTGVGQPPLEEEQRIFTSANDGDKLFAVVPCS